MKRLYYIFIFFIAIHAQASEPGSVLKGIRISYIISDSQIAFIDSHYDFVMTRFLSPDIRNKIQHADLYLYRSIQGYKKEWYYFDWDHLNAHENMFCHTDSANQTSDTRITTIWETLLMNGRDMVDKNAADAMNHWINYYAVTSSTQVHDYDYDGLFIDSAGHILKSSWMKDGELPWDYNADSCRVARQRSLKFIKSYLPDKMVVFNGLHSDNGADSSLTFTDGGMWEDFAYDINTGDYKGVGNWWKAITYMKNHRDSSYLVLVVKKPGLMNDMQARIFSVASYLLINDQNVVFSMYDYAFNTSVQYYPEYEIDLGQPEGDFIMTSDSLIVREFEKGYVAVNPFASESKTLMLEKTYYKIVPEGGGFVDSLGHWDGKLTYEEVKGTIELPPVSALILKDSLAVGIAQPSPFPKELSLAQNYPNPFNPSTTIAYRLVNSSWVSIDIYDIHGRLVKNLLHGRQQAGYHTLKWDGTDVQGKSLSSGIYFYRLKANKREVTKRMLLLR